MWSSWIQSFNECGTFCNAGQKQVVFLSIYPENHKHSFNHHKKQNKLKTMGRKLFSNKTNKTCFQKNIFMYFFRTHTKIKRYTNFNLKYSFVSFLISFLPPRSQQIFSSSKHQILRSGWTAPLLLSKTSQSVSTRKSWICGSRRHRYDVSTRLSISGVRGIFRF